MIIDESSAPEGADDPEDVDDPDLSVRDENVRGRSNLHTYIFFLRILHWTIRLKFLILKMIYPNVANKILS